MTTVTVKKQNSCIREVIVDGHSGYQSEGSDIVCASISTLLITTVNACLRVEQNSITYVKKEGFVAFTVKQENAMIQLLLENMVDLFKELQTQYKKYIKINEEV